MFSVTPFTKVLVLLSFQNDQLVCFDFSLFIKSYSLFKNLNDAVIPVSVIAISFRRAINNINHLAVSALHKPPYHLDRQHFF